MAASTPCVLGRGVRPDGKTVLSLSDVTGLGGPGMYLLARLVARCPGQTLKSVIPHLTVSPLVGPDLLVAMRQGAVDMAFLVDPLTRAPGLSEYAAFASPARSGEGPGVDIAGWALGSLRRDRPEVADAFVRATIRTVRTHLQGN